MLKNGKEAARTYTHSLNKITQYLFFFCWVVRFRLNVDFSSRFFFLSSPLRHHLVAAFPNWPDEGKNANTDDVA